MASLKPDHATLDVSGAYGIIGGFISIPKGGMYGTAINDKPSFSDIGIKNNLVGSVEISATYGAWTYYGKLKSTNFNGSYKTDKELITHGVVLDKGTDYTIDTPMDIYSFGAKREIRINDHFTVSPIMGIEFERIAYTWSATSNTKGIHVPNGNGVNSLDNTRGYFNFIAPAAGLQSDYYFSDKTEVQFMAESIIPLGTDWKYYVDTSIKLIHTVYTSDNYVSDVKLYTGLEAYTTKTRDTQKEMQNHIKIHQAPMVSAGVIVTFI